MIIHAMNTPLQGVAPLTHTGLIRAQGADAAKFLHGQLTTDFSLLGLSEARLAGFCNAKGRLQASFIGFKRSHTDMDASAEFVVYGLAGPAVAEATQAIADENGQVWRKADLNGISIVHLYPADGVPRALWVAPVGTPAPAGAPLTAEQWAWGEVRSGIATVTHPIFEAFVPQMLNYESVGGVNFKKGCYPGQEVVARSQFRGTLKRRAYLAHADVELKAGEELFAPDDASQPCGLVVQAALAPEGGFDAIVSMQISAFEAGGVRALAADGPLLKLEAAPYPLLADV